MRIALLTDTFLPVTDGVGRVVTGYAEALPKLGHQVIVSAPMYDGGHRGGDPYELLDYRGFRVPGMPQYKTGLPAMDLHYRRRIDMLPIDILHAHSPFAAGMEALRLKKQRNVPLVTTFHSKYYDDFLKITRNKAAAKALLAIIMRFYRRCDEVWTVSESSAKVLSDYGFKGPIQVMPNGTALRSTTPAAVREAEERFGLFTLPLLLYVGQINWKKNILRILEAAALLKKENPNFKLLLVGRGEDEKEIRATIEKLGLLDQAVMTGVITSNQTLDALYKRARLFVFPSLYDTFSMVVREAAAMGTPSVAVGGSAAAEMIAHGQNGFLCLDKTESLLDVMKLALSDPALFERAGKAAQSSIPVAWEQALEQVVDRYKNLINTQRRDQGKTTGNA